MTSSLRNRLSFLTLGADRSRDAPVIRQLFSSSPRDPRYHMLQYISSKFSQNIRPQPNEPRAALFLNRFSRTLTIMYATNGLADLLGISSDQLTGKSFYYCIQENCLREGVKCLESAKANDSIAYLRFWFRDPRQHDISLDQDEPMTDGNSSGDDDDGGVNLSHLMDRDGSEHAISTGSSNSMRSSVERDTRTGRNLDPNSRSSSENSTDMGGNSNDRMFDRPEGQQSRTSSISTPDDSGVPFTQPESSRSEIEVEAVVSCTSDGLVVVLRGARPFVPHLTIPSTEPPKSQYRNGFFASPWSNDPVVPDADRRSGNLPCDVQPSRFPLAPTAGQAATAATTGPYSEDFMNSIRETAVFAWSLTGINGSLAQYGRGTPSGESQPSTLQIWQPSGDTKPSPYHPRAQSQLLGGGLAGHMPPMDSGQAVGNSKGEAQCNFNHPPSNGLPDGTEHQNNGYSSHGYHNSGDASMDVDCQHTKPNNKAAPGAHEGASSMWSGHDPHMDQMNGWGNQMHQQAKGELQASQQHRGNGTSSGSSGSRVPWPPG